ncbi:organoarsenical effux MFS transporter ArsJ [Varunaivibrio sulfuroxidans]|uniref:MFS transporter n=1 Tax=Varunaivibrio sulfuroxidans TaxID=1773489 RepID=A0A4R3JFN0_9PROT|nr:organoarsenical effux MFS transporter ArsJ [Varunaivibrio sulfuroxidans]TCS64949.1 MFS transporter [Varunaivibrio sulfuroxidans]WES29759.1 organoarsenical effux MFS transporter ArsJ [Varunaivibrio sulfuroxidans]
MRSKRFNYGLVTAAYWGFTLTDGALRMLVLLYFYRLGYSPLEIAFLFVFYEIFGVITNLIGGWIGNRLGLKITLFSGLGIQIGALIMLAGFSPAWPLWAAVSYVTAAQALSGVAKDLTKMSSKSAVKLLVSGDDHGGLFKWVALLTGSKNALKGVGFFMGGALLAAYGFQGALYAMAGALAVLLAGCAVLLEGTIGQVNRGLKFREIFSKNPNINILSAARLFLFGSRDIWFVVGLPLYLAATMGWSNEAVGGYLAAWVVGYGVVQALAPKILRKAAGAPDDAQSRRWILILIAVTAAIAAALVLNVMPVVAVLGGLIVFGFVFAVNSAIHSYLILAYTEADKIAMNVGFYYMANAGGRLAGTVLSGLAYQWGGMLACLSLSALFLLASWATSLRLDPPGGRVRQN